MTLAPAINMLRNRTFWRTLGALLVSHVIVPLVWGQEVPKLEVEVSPSGQVKILARDVSYAQILRALQEKLDVVIEIPPLAEELKLSYARIDAAQPEEAFEKLLTGSGLGYGLRREANTLRIVKAVVVALTQKRANGEAIQVPTGPTVPTPQVPQIAAQPLSEAGIVTNPQFGKPGEATTGRLEKLSPESQPVGEAPLTPVNRPLSDAARAVGVPGGALEGEIGKTKTLPLPPEGQKRP